MASKLRPNGVNRRHFLRISAIGTVTTVLGMLPPAASAHAGRPDKGAARQADATKSSPS